MSNNITNEIITSYLSGLYVNENEKLKELRDFAEKDRVPIILKDTEGLLVALMKLKQPIRVLEIGTAVGYSACVFANCCKCKVLSIESNEEMADIAESNIKQLGFDDRIEILRGDARKVLEGLDDSFDIIFIDAAKSHYKEFWDLSRPMLKDEGLIICDNVLMKGKTASDEFDPRGRYKTSIRRMREFLQYINSIEDMFTSIVPVGDGLSISVYEGK